MKLPPERCEIDAFEFRLEWLEFCAALFEQRAEPGGVAAGVMMERRSHLDEAMKKGLRSPVAFNHTASSASWASK